MPTVGGHEEACRLGGKVGGGMDVVGREQGGGAKVRGLTDSGFGKGCEGGVGWMEEFGGEVAGERIGEGGLGATGRGFVEAGEGGGAKVGKDEGGDWEEAVLMVALGREGGLEEEGGGCAEVKGGRDGVEEGR